jgi:hypothetical protein
MSIFKRKEKEKTPAQLAVEEADKARRERLRLIADLKDTKGWGALTEEIEARILSATNELGTRQFTDLRQVDALQERIDTLRKVIGLPEELVRR